MSFKEKTKKFVKKFITKSHREGDDGTSSFHPDVVKGDPDPPHIVELNASNTIDRERLKDSMQVAGEALRGVRDVAGGSLEQYKKPGSYGKVGESVVQRLYTFTKSVQGIADAHIYSKMAWKVISGVITALANAEDVDQNILDLFDILNTTYKILEDAEDIEKHPAHGRILTNLATQTVDWLRAGKTLVGRPIKPRVKLYQDALSSILKELEIHSVIHTEIAVGRLLEGQRRIVDRVDIDSLPYATGAGFSSDRQCLPGTRIELLEEVSDWVINTHESRIFLLAGPAGVGKSTIAHSIAARFKTLGRLGSFFGFDRSDLDHGGRRSKIFSTIARDLADLDQGIRNELAKVIKNQASLRGGADLRQQWNNLILEPLRAISDISTGPILVVIDGIDESGSDVSRQHLLEILGEEASSLPYNVRFLITSRWENDIIQTLNKPYVQIKGMDNIPKAETERDLRTYFETSLAGEKYFGDAQLRNLVTLSQGLFQWAHLASQYLKGLGNTSGLTVAERYRDLVDRSDNIRFINQPLDAMYTRILVSLFDPTDFRVMTRFRSVLGSILFTYESLSLASLIALRGDDITATERESNIKVIIQSMGSLLSGINNPSSTISILHSSFREYLLDPERSHGFSIVSSQCHRDLFLGCLRIMVEGLVRVNDTSTSQEHSAGSSDKDRFKLVSPCISIPLSYSSRFWATHLSSITDFDNFLAGRVEEFLRRRFLIWLEVLGSLSAIQDVAGKAMSRLISLTLENQSFDSLHDFATTAKRFLKVFNNVVGSQIYIPNPSSGVIGCRLHNASVFRPSFNGYREAFFYRSERAFIELTSICFSDRGEYLAIGREDGTVRLTDLKTLRIIWSLQLHRDAIGAIQFQNGDTSFLFSSAMAIYLVDIRVLTCITVKQLGSFLPANPDSILFSPNSKFVAFFHGASLSSNNPSRQLSVWPLETDKIGERIINIPSKDADLYYSFANTDEHILITYRVGSGVEVWDLRLPDNALRLFQRPSDVDDTVNPICIPPDGKHIIFTEKSCLRVWNYQENSTIILDGYMFPDLNWPGYQWLQPDLGCQWVWLAPLVTRSGEVKEKWHWLGLIWPWIKPWLLPDSVKLPVRHRNDSLAAQPHLGSWGVGQYDPSLYNRSSLSV